VRATSHPLCRIMTAGTGSNSDACRIETGAEVLDQAVPLGLPATAATDFDDMHASARSIKASTSIPPLPCSHVAICVTHLCAFRLQQLPQSLSKGYGPFYQGNMLKGAREDYSQRSETGL
jgi:hypothetical protein